MSGRASTPRGGLRAAGALAALAALAGCARDLDAWEAATRSPDPYERLLAACALTSPAVLEAAPLRAFEALRPLSADPDPRVQDRVVAALRDSETLFRACLRALCAEGDQVAGRALVARGPRALPDLVAALLDPRCGERALVARAIAALGPPAVPWLAVPLVHADSQVRWAALEAVERLGPSARALRPLVVPIRDGAEGALRERAEAALAALEGE